MYPIDGPSLNLEIADLRHIRVGALRGARQPNGVAVRGTGRKLDGRGFNSRYDQIEDSLRKNQTLDEIWTVFCGPFWSKTCFAALVLKYSSFVWLDSSASTHLTTDRQMASLVDFNHDEQPSRELSKSSRLSVRLFLRLFSATVFLSLRPNPTPPHPHSHRLQAG